MTTRHSISIRISTEKKLIYEAEATARDLPLRTYLRKRLEENDEIILRIKETIEAATKSQESSSKNKGVELEMLLLLRQIAQPQKVQLAQHELKRLGFTIWSPQADKER